MSIFKMTATGDGPKAKSKRISEGTEQQEQFWQELINGASHVMVEARAGCGKSSAVREGMHRLLAADPAVRMTYAVYNKINADEFRDDCPQGVETGTMHSLGLKLLRQSYGSQVEKLKTYSLLDTYQEGKNLPRYVRKSIAFLTSKAKDEMLIPDAPELAKSLHQLIDKYGINPFGRAGVIEIMPSTSCGERRSGWRSLITKICSGCRCCTRSRRRTLICFFWTRRRT